MRKVPARECTHSWETGSVVLPRPGPPKTGFREKELLEGKEKCSKLGTDLRDLSLRTDSTSPRPGLLIAGEEMVSPHWRRLKKGQGLGQPMSIKASGWDAQRRMRIGGAWGLESLRVPWKGRGARGVWRWGKCRGCKGQSGSRGEGCDLGSVISEVGHSTGAHLPSTWSTPGSARQLFLLELFPYTPRRAWFSFLAVLCDLSLPQVKPAET